MDESAIKVTEPEVHGHETTSRKGENMESAGRSAKQSQSARSVRSLANPAINASF